MGRRGIESATIAITFVLALSVLAPALADEERPRGFAVTQWTSAEGLPVNTVLDLGQTPDGYLWMATTAGLVRFDGHEFTVFDLDDGLEEFRLIELHVTPEGQLLLLSERGSIWDYDAAGAGRFERRFQGQSIRRIGLDGRGNLWAFPLDEPPADGSVRAASPPPASLASFELDEAGELWTRLRDGRVAKLEGERFEPVGDPVKRPKWVVTAPSKGQVLVPWLEGEDDGVTLKDVAGATVARYRPAPERYPMLVDRLGDLWLAGPDRVDVLDGSTGRPVWHLELPTGTRVSSYLEDLEGNIWLGTTTQGLYRVRRTSLFTVGGPEGVSDCPARQLLSEADGKFIFAAAGSRACLYDAETEALDVISDFGDTPRVFIQPDGTAWEWRQGRLGRRGSLQGDNSVPVGGGRYPIGQFHLDRFRDDQLWLVAGGLVSQVQLEEPPTLISSYPVRRPRQFLQDRNGVVWVASEYGLMRIEHGQSTLMTREDGTPWQRVRAIHQTADGTLWFGTYGHGLLRYRDGAFSSLGERQGLAENFVTTILEDDFGNFWMTGNLGIHRVARVQLEEVFDGRASRVAVTTYGREAGLTNPESSGFPGVVDSSGRFLLPTLGGVVVVDPEALLAEDRIRLSLHIEEVRTLPDPLRRGKAGRRGDGDDGIVVRPRQRRLEIDYTAVALSSPENVRFEYRLDGFESNWNDVGTIRTARYTSLGPGEYTFRVRARNANEAFEEEVALAVRVQAAYYETGWFSALGVLLAGLVAVGFAWAVNRRLRSRAAELEAVVARRTEELAAERDMVAQQVVQLKELESAKSRFFANISHEFRTPLTLIQGPLEDLRDGAHGPLGESGRKQVELAARNSHRLLHLVEQLLGIARAESGRLVLQARRQDLGTLVHRMGQAFAAAAERKSIRLEVEVPSRPVELYFDSEHVEQIVTNLVGNALKFTQEGGNVRVVLDDTSTRGEHTVCLEIVDDGPGIAREELPHVFDRFRRGRSAETQVQPGTGIGLALARELVRLHGGKIEVESKSGEGSTFRVWFRSGRGHLRDDEIVSAPESQLLERVEKYEGATGASTASAAAMVDVGELSDSVEEVAGDGDSSAFEDITSVLIVDDSSQVRGYLRGHLESRYRVLEAPDGVEALRIARESLPDAIISDVMMPRLDGVGFCAEIKRDPELNFIPVILLTAKASVESKISGLEEGADDYLTKPFNARELEARVGNLIASRRKLKERFESSSAPPATAPAPVVERAPTFYENVQAAIVEGMTDEAFGVDALARAVGQSRTSLYRRLKETTSASPLELIRNARLEAAAKLLKERDASVSEIGYAVGFRSLAYFSNSFKQRYGTSPTAYRER